MIFWSILAVAVALGWDSLAAGLGIGTVAESRRRVFQLALAFGISDGIASAIGMACGHVVGPVLRVGVEIAGPLLIAITGIVIIGFPDFAQRAFSPNRWMLMGVPVAFTLDNLNVGFGRGLDHMPAILEPLLIGVVSGLMAWAGITLALRWQRLLPEFAPRIAGVVLLAVGVHELVT